MLETKRVNAYGKRAKRVVYVSVDKETLCDSPVKKSYVHLENGISMSPPSAHKILSRGRKVNGQSTSPRGSPKAANIFGIKKTAVGISTTTPNRKPLSLKSTTLPASPSIIYLGHKAPQALNTKMTSFAPFLDSEMVVSDEPTRGPKTVQKDSSNPSRLRNEVEMEIGEGHTVRPPRRRAVERPIIISDDEYNDDDSDGYKLRRSTRGVKANPIVISDSSSDEDLKHLPRKPAQNRPVRLLKGKYDGIMERQPAQIEEVISIPSYPHLPPVRNPRRNPQKSSQDNQIQSSRHLLSVSNILDPFATLEISRSKNKRDFQSTRNLPAPEAESSHRQTVPTHLAPLLAHCEQAEPHCFSSFVEAFPLDQLHDSGPTAELTFRKVGEASYSEVFAIGDIVLKIIPLRNESCTVPQTDEDVDLPPESEAKDVLREVIVTRSMGQTCPGFIKLLRTYVVVGEYPSLLLSLWDLYKTTKSSENVRPDVFPPTQAYALLVLPNGGPDLEAYTFPTKTGWRQACSIFWQVANALAIAESLVSFEHRDLHWGQVLVKASVPTRNLPPRAPSRRARLDVDGIGGTVIVPMDHPSHGVTVTIIDLGLARMDAADSNGNAVYWTAFEEFIFEGEGDYQFDVYRMMRRVHRDGKWDHFCALTNVMWLHYLTTKLIRSKRLRPPGGRSSTTVNGFGEKQCYDCLVEMEQLLGNCMPSLKGKKNRGAGSKALFSKARDVVDFGRGRGWLE